MGQKLKGATALSENADAKEALDKIGGRLSGVYNLVNPAAKRIKEVHINEDKCHLLRGAWCPTRRGPSVRLCKDKWLASSTRPVVRKISRKCMWAGSHGLDNDG